MIKKVLLFIAAMLCSLSLFAQESDWGGVKGTVVNRAGRAPIAEAALTLSQNGETVATATSDAEGKFLIEGLPNGIYDMTIKAAGFLDATVNVTVEGYVKDLIFVGMVVEQVIADVDDSNFAEFDMDDSGFEDAPSILFDSNDPFTNIASFGFSNIRFKNRGYTNESQDVYLSGVRMNDAITGYSPYSLWSGLNEAMRSKETTIGNEVSDYGYGGYNGVTNIHAMPSSVRTGWRFSALTNSALYRLRLMATYASGELDNGWSYAFNVSARVGGNDWVKGVYYRNFAYYAGVEKKFGDTHRLSLVTFAAPGQRGAQNASTQEVYDLIGDNMYNSNWGYQNGKVRNARVRKTFEPVTILKYTATPSDNLEASATVLWRTGKNGYTAMDWYDAADPRPDYYRNLPSYYWMDNKDYGRLNFEKAAWAKDAWINDIPEYTHLNWDRLYNVNWNNYDADGLRRSKYAVEERRVDQNDINLNASIKWMASKAFTLTGGINYKWNRTEYYKKMDDLLGGDYYLNIDQFAERDFASSPTMVQNDLDYFLEFGEAKSLKEGDKYGYDYYAHVRNANLWANGALDLGGFKANLALEAGYAKFWREGLVRKGLFAGLDENGNEMMYEGKVLTTYDAKTGKAITSKGNSEIADFLTYSAKLGLQYHFEGGHRIYVNGAYFNDAPTFAQSFISPRTRNSMVPNLTTVKTASADINYQYSNNGYNFRITGFWTNIADQTDMMSFYDDSQNSFVNFAMNGIDQRHIGLEMGFKIPLPVQGLSLAGALSWGEYIYTSVPRMTMTVDNSAELIYDNQPVPYWASSPVYRKTVMDGETVYETDLDGEPVVERFQKHYVPSTPQLAADLGLNYRTNSYWFFELHAQYFAKSYLDMNPLYRTDWIVAGPDWNITPTEVEDLTSQECFAPAFLLNASIGKSWYIDRKYNFGFSLNLQNITNNRNVRTGGYEGTRLADSETMERYYKFDSKYFYMQGFNYMLNLYFRF
ncbi:MAG: TonB-dependent receptor [Bacteroidales bacterium]|nr:TonB-dependent receptor [Bacteroidales bacterium]